MPVQFNAVAELQARGMVHDMTPGTEAQLLREPTTFYIGFDPTALSLHIGNLAVIMLMVHLQRAGHTPIALVGGATGMIGDPSGKREERQLLSIDVLRANQAGIEAQLRTLLDFTGANAALVVNNYDWTASLTLLDFLRDVGKHLSVNYMMAKDSVKNRLETGISFTEFSYQLLQAYDYYWLYTHKGCKLQMGGSDQWGNITSGTELIRRMQVGSEEVETSPEASAFALTSPLVTKNDGTKFGKSEQGNVWLDAARTSPYRFYQFWLNTADADLERLLLVFSLKPVPEIRALLAAHDADRGMRIAQKALAEELTQRIHGEPALKQAQAAAAVLFGDDDPDALRKFTAAQIADLFEGMPSGSIPASKLQLGMPIIEFLKECGAYPSNTESRKAILAGAVRLNKRKIEDEKTLVSPADVLAGAYVLVQKGKKTYHLARVG